MTKFKRKIKQLGLSEEQLSTSVELLEWVRKHKDKFYIPESVLAQFNFKTEFDEKDLAAYSLVEGTIVPDQVPIEQDTIDTIQ